MKRKFLSGLLLAFLVLPTMAAAASYSSTYDMTGGVFSSYINMGAKRTVTVTTTPTINEAGSGAKIYLYLQKQTWYGYDDVANSWNYAGTPDTSKEMVTGDAGQYRVYLRNYTGLRMAGYVSISD